MTNIQHCNGSFRAALGTAAMLLLLIALPQTRRARLAPGGLAAIAGPGAASH